MKTEKINIDSLEKIENLASAYKFALVYEFSNTELSYATQVKWDLDELSEAYLFNQGEQIHIFRVGNEIKAVHFCEDQSDSFVDRKFKLDGKHKDVGKTIVIREYLEQDEDGQAIVSYTRLYDVNGEE